MSRAAMMTTKKAGPIEIPTRSDTLNSSRSSSVSDVFSDGNALDSSELHRYSSHIDDGDRHFQPISRSPSLTQRPLSSHSSVQSRLQSLHRSGSSQRYPVRTPSMSRRDIATATDSEVNNVLSDRFSTIAGSTPHRGMSIASRITAPRAESPYHGTNGPSHPYAMYYQDNGVGRTQSNATASTFRSVPRSYTGPSRPTHPYGSYAQDTASADELSITAAAPRVTPLGSATRDQRYQRRLGSDGEDADDIIGPDGHTEQLPPYTRYANDLPPKESPSEPDVPADPQQNPFGDSQASPSPSSARQLLFENSGPAAGLSTQNAESTRRSRQTDGGGHFKELVTERSKKKICGLVPVWLLVLLIVLIIGVVIGGAVGAGIRHARHSVQTEPAPPLHTTAAAATVTITSLIDAAPITATPSNLPPLPTGTYSVPLDLNSGLFTSNNSCLVDEHMKNTWDCANGANLDLVLLPSDGNPRQAQITADIPTNAPILYGAQPPSLSRPAELMLMNDKEEMNRGPAYFFQELYDKLVVVRESDFNTSNMKRWLEESSDESTPKELGKRNADDWNNHPVALPADKPWFCFWNQTVLEGFIYITQDADDSKSAHSTAQSAGGAATSSLNAAVSSAVSPANSALGLPMLGNVGYPAAAPTTTPSLQYRQALDCPFPKVVKLEERRGPTRAQPYCQQMQIMNDRTASPITIAPSGVFNIVNITEEEPSGQKRLTYYNGPSQQKEKRHRYQGAFLASDCQCQWLND